MTLLEIADTGSTSIMLEDNVFGTIIGWNAEANTVLVQVPTEDSVRIVECSQVSNMGGGALRQRPKDSSFATMLDIIAVLGQLRATIE